MAHRSTMKGKQSVSYRQLSDEGFDALINLPKSAATLLFLIVKDTDKKDNCCQLNPKQLIEKYGLNHGNTYTHLRKLKAVNFLREVDDIYGLTRLMVNPEWLSWQKRDLVRFTILMYSLGSHNAVIEHLDMEDKSLGRIDIHTGEHFDWFRTGIEKANCHYGLPVNGEYEYVSVNICTSTEENQHLPANSLNTGTGYKQEPYSPEELSGYDEYSYEEVDDYDDAYQFRRKIPAMLSVKDVVSRMT